MGRLHEQLSDSEREGAMIYNVFSLAKGWRKPRALGRLKISRRSFEHAEAKMMGGYTLCASSACSAFQAAYFRLFARFWSSNDSKIASLLYRIPFVVHTGSYKHHRRSRIRV